MAAWALLLGGVVGLGLAGCARATPAADGNGSATRVSPGWELREVRPHEGAFDYPALTLAAGSPVIALQDLAGVGFLALSKGDAFRYAPLWSSGMPQTVAVDAAGEVHVGGVAVDVTDPSFVLRYASGSLSGGALHDAAVRRCAFAERSGLAVLPREGAAPVLVASCEGRTLVMVGADADASLTHELSDGVAVDWAITPNGELHLVLLPKDARAGAVHVLTSPEGGEVRRHTLDGSRTVRVAVGAQGEVWLAYGRREPAAVDHDTWVAPLTAGKVGEPERVGVGEPMALTVSPGGAPVVVAGCRFMDCGAGVYVRRSGDWRALPIEGVVSDLGAPAIAVDAADRVHLVFATNTDAGRRVIYGSSALPR